MYIDYCEMLKNYDFPFRTKGADSSSSSGQTVAYLNCNNSPYIKYISPC